jgi:hypothetical protein
MRAWVVASWLSRRFERNVRAPAPRRSCISHASGDGDPPLPAPVDSCCGILPTQRSATGRGPLGPVATSCTNSGRSHSGGSAIVAP